MVANLTLKESEQGLPAVVDPDQVQKSHRKLPDGIFGGLGLQPPMQNRMSIVETIRQRLFISSKSY
jgi:hypothetical protein